MAQKSQQSALNELIAEQKLLCEEFDSAYVEVKGDDVVAVAVHTLNQEPIVGLRKKPETEENVAWFIYGGELGEGQDFFYNHDCTRVTRYFARCTSVLGSK